MVVQTGGTERNAVSGFDKLTGDLLWATESDTILYQSPIIASLFEQTQIVCVGEHTVFGLEPNSGKLLWKFRHQTEGRGGINPVQVDEDKLFLNNWRSSLLLQIQKEEGRYSVSELLRTRNIKQTYNVPVYHEGHFYGYSSRFLTCVDVTNGETVWKSRPQAMDF